MQSARHIARETYKVFSEKEGNKHIASEGALRFILKYLKRARACMVLEIGTGIGTVCHAVMHGAGSGYLNRDLRYCGTEANKFCLLQIKKNIGSRPNTLIFPSLDEVPEEMTFDFIVVDGRDSALATLPRRLNKHGIIFIEGGRSSQVKKLLLKKKERNRPFASFAETMYKRRPYGPFQDRRFGAGTVIIFDPTLHDYAYAFVRKIVGRIKYSIYGRA